MNLRSILPTLVLVCTSPLLAADPAGVIRTYSTFPDDDIAQAMQGKIETERGPMFATRRGLQTQALFVLKKSPAEVAKALEEWDPTDHSELGTAIHLELKPQQASESLHLLEEQADIGMVARLLEPVKDSVGGSARFQIGVAELLDLQKNKPADSKAVARWLQKIMAVRAEAVLQQGLSAAPEIPVSEGSVRPAAEIKSLLQETPAVAARFDGLFAAALKNRDKSGQGYWEVFRVDHDTALCLGQVWKRPLEDGFQVMDAQYYVTTGYHVSVTLYDIFPINGGSLVWRADYLSAPTLATTKGMERMAYASVMQKEIKKAIEAFRADLLK